MCANQEDPAALSSDDAVTAGTGDRGGGPGPTRALARVRTIEHTWIPLPDGTRLAARIWLP